MGTDRQKNRDVTQTLSKVVRVQNMRGLHARAAARFCERAARHTATIEVTYNQHTVGGCSLMALLMLGAARGAEITIEAKGQDAAAALDDLEDLIMTNFGEAE